MKKMNAHYGTVPTRPYAMPHAPRRLAFMASMLILFCTLLTAQTPYTISWVGLSSPITAQNVPTGITVTQQYNGVTASCNTGQNGGTTSYSLKLKAAVGFHFTITSIGGSAYASSAGSKQFTFQLTNGSVYTQANFSTIGVSSNCTGNAALNAFSVPTAGQTVTSGNEITITVLRAPGGASGNGYSWTRSVTVTGIVTPDCTTPSGLAANNITTTSADLSWNTISGVAGYEYVVDQTSAAPAGSGAATTTNSYSATSLNPGTVYYLHVRTNCTAPTYSGWATTSFTTTALPTCAAPTGLLASNTTTSSADLSWDAQTGVAGYEYIVDQVATAPTGAGAATTNTTTSATPLSPGTVYYLHVRTDCGSGLSAWTTASFTTTALPPCNDPTGLTATNVTSTGADLNWDTQTGVAGYEYIVDQVATAPTGSGTAITNTTAPVTSLNPGNVYYLHVRTNCGPNVSNWATTSFTTACAQPTGLVAANITPTAADLSWAMQAGVAGYEYVVDQLSADPLAAGTATTSTNTAVSSLTPGSVYYLHVRTNCGINLSTWSTFSFTTACTAPGNLVAANITPTGADLSWDALTGVAGYEYAIDQLSADPVGSGTAVTTNSTAAVGLTSNGVYYLHVRTNCGVNFSNWSSLSFTIAPCDVPTGLVSGNIVPTGADLNWSSMANINGFNYVIDQNTANPFGNGLATATNSVAASGLNPNTGYYIHLRTDCGYNNYSPWTILSFTTALPPCNDPTGLATSNLTSTGSDFVWDTQSGVAGYEYTVDQTATAPTASGTAITNTTTGTSGLTPNTVYYIHLRTNCGLNYSNWITLSFTTALPPCPDPTGLTVGSITTSGANVTWNAQSGVAGFEYTIDQTLTAPTASGTATTNTTTASSGLTPNSVYYVHLRTNCGLNYSNWVTLSFTTSPTPCSPATGLAASNITTSSASLSWNTQASASGYEYTIDQTATAPSASGTATTTTSTAASSLAAGTVYYLHVRANCGSGNLSGWATISFTTAINSTGINDVQDNISLTVSPNPANETLTVNLNGTAASHATLSIIDLTGKTIKAEEMNGNSIQVNVSALSPGLYFIRFNNAQAVKTYRFIKN